MAYLEMPVRSDIPAYTFQTTLEGITYGFDFHYNKRLARWSFDILDSEGVDIVNGIPLLTNLALIDRYPYEGLPKGEFLVLDETGNNLNPEDVGLGDDYKLLYRESTTDD